jgi:hypothetical protein
MITKSLAMAMLSLGLQCSSQTSVRRNVGRNIGRNVAVLTLLGLGVSREGPAIGVVEETNGISGRTARVVCSFT